MNGFPPGFAYERETISAVIHGANPLVERNIRVRLRANKHGLCGNLIPPARPTAKFQRATGRLQLRLAAHIPLPRAENLYIETGEVREQFLSKGRRHDAGQHPYCLVHWCGMVLHLEQYLLDVRKLKPLSVISFQQVPGSLPVILGPSAILSLTLELREKPESQWCENESENPIAVLETDISPYPPHCIPQAIAAMGVYGYVSCDPETWTSPLLALPMQYGILIIQHRKNGALPQPALVLDSALPLGTGPDSYFECEFHVLGASSAIEKGESPIRIKTSPEKMLGAAVASVRPPEPGVVCDPILGNRYGRAATMVTELKAHDLEIW